MRPAGHSGRKRGLKPAPNQISQVSAPATAAAVKQEERGAGGQQEGATAAAVRAGEQRCRELRQAFEDARRQAMARGLPPGKRATWYTSEARRIFFAAHRPVETFQYPFFCRG